MKIVEVLVDSSYEAISKEIAEKHGTPVLWEEHNDGRHALRLLVEPAKRQDFLDELQGHLEASPTAQIIVMPVEAVLPRPKAAEPEPGKKKTAATTREELYSGVEKNAQLDGTFIVLVVLSTIVAAIGLVEDNVAVVIGAMVIAPLLGPNIALALASTLGDRELMMQSLKTNSVGLGIAFGLSVMIGMLIPPELKSHELLARTDVGLDSVALALASGGAAVLSLTTGLSSVLVGVMVAVALLPPTTTLGIMIGRGSLDLAAGAALLLAVNVVSVNLSAKLTFLARGITPRTLSEKLQARQSVVVSLAVWLISLAVLVGVILYKKAQ